MSITALTVWQPWASLLATGAKHFETRAWPTAYRGQIAIHAAAEPFVRTIRHSFPLGEWEYSPDFRAKSVFMEALTRALDCDPATLPTGAVLATADLVNVWRICYHPGGDVDRAKHISVGGESMTLDKRDPRFNDTIVPTETELIFGNWTPGRYAWQLENVRLFAHPIPAKGNQRLWQWEPPKGWCA